ncbi:hypothetical protein [Lacticaseibacillus zhaodongensis]|uniref:hypothetical protein n=1 Tax=Lacticaseibacillus zhaodongensis TaxID=2668065 RepID=UPI0012D301CF|nr:hypothetical protein [Lacticaseibacillus zhaodongensis]
MVSETEYTQLYAKRMALIEADPQYTVLASMNKPMADGATKVTQYIVYTDFKNEGQKERTSSIFVYTPYANVDKYGHSKADFQAQLLFELNQWNDVIHITVLETLGSESRLAFFDYQNLGLAQLALRSLLNLANKLGVGTIDGNISSFDKEKFAKIVHIFEKFTFKVTIMDAEHGIGKISKTLQS